VRFANYEPVTPMKYLKSQCIGKFVSVKGTVIRVSTIKPVLVEMKFLCTKCGFETLQRMTEGRFEAPAYCGQVRSSAWTRFHPLLLNRRRAPGGHERLMVLSDVLL